MDGCERKTFTAVSSPTANTNKQLSQIQVAKEVSWCGGERDQKKDLERKQGCFEWKEETGKDIYTYFPATSHGLLRTLQRRLDGFL